MAKLYFELCDLSLPCAHPRSTFFLDVASGTDVFSRGLFLARENGSDPGCIKIYLWSKKEWELRKKYVYDNFDFDLLNTMPVGKK